MAIQIAGVSLPGPTEFLDVVRSVTGWGAETIDMLAGLPARVANLLDDVEQLVRRINDVTDRATGVVVQVTGVTEDARGLLAEAGDLSRGADELLTVYRPMATQAAPLARRFVEELSEQEIIAAVRLVDQLPALAEHMETDVMPILATLDRVGPDIHELLAVVKELRQVMDAIPGLGMLRRRDAPQPPDAP